MASRKMQLNLNIEELPNIKKRIADLTAARDAAVARAEAAEQAVRRVRELHQKRAFTKYEYCVECDVDERAAPWPCDTIRALDGAP